MSDPGDIQGSRQADTNEAVVPAVVSEIKTVLDQAADMLPEANYIGFSLATVILSSVGQELFHTVESVVPQTRVAGPVWNYLDSGASLVTGLVQLTDKYHHRPMLNKLKGIGNASSGIQAAVLTGINFSLFGGPSFAVGFGIGFVLSLDETVRMARRQLDFNYWVKDNFAELESIRNLIIPDLEKSIQRLEGKDSDSRSRMHHWALKRKQNRLQEYKNKATKIEDELVDRLAYRKSFEKNEGSKEFKEYKAAIEVVDGLSSLDTTSKTTKSFSGQLNSELDRVILNGPQTLLAKETKIDVKNQLELSNAAFNTVCWGVAFTGMLLLCIPGAQAAGVVVVAAASLLYLGKFAIVRPSQAGFFSQGQKESLTERQYVAATDLDANLGDGKNQVVDPKAPLLAGDLKL